MFESTIRFIKDLYPGKRYIPLHEPVFLGREKAYVAECIDSTFVSSVGTFVNKFEKQVADYVGSSHAVATMNGTAALHIALLLSGVDEDSEVLTQALTFVATANAISYCHANPIFIDSEINRLGMCPESLASFLYEYGDRRNGSTFNKKTGRQIRACVPMHVFGHPLQIERIADICRAYQIDLIEDAAESLGSRVGSRHTGTFGKTGIFSFNGNKTVTCGGGGMIVTDDPELAYVAKHLTTTAKKPHSWEFVHDRVGYNYRMPNLNAALGCAQMEQLDKFLFNKRQTAESYRSFFATEGIPFVTEPEGTCSNYWLNAILLRDRSQRDSCLTELNDAGIQARPIWELMPDLPAFRDAQHTNLTVARNLIDRCVNLPSGVRTG